MTQTATHGPPDACPPARGVGRLFVAVFLAFGVLYALTAQHGPAWQDSGIFQLRAMDMDLAGHMGLALAHPLLILLGRLFSFLPAGDLAWRMNMVSAVFMALAAGNVAVLVRRLAPRRRSGAWIAAGLFGLAHTTWWLATITESQAVHVALFTGGLNVLAMLVERPRLRVAALLGLLSGLALTAHDLALLALPAYGLTVIYLCARRRLSWAGLPLFVVGWLAGAGGLLILVANGAMEAGWATAIRSALFGGDLTAKQDHAGWRQQVLGGTGKAVAMGCAYILYNFPNLALPAAGLALPALRKRLPGPLAWTILYLLGIYLLFPIRYAVADQFMFFLPFYAMVSVLAGLALGNLPAGRGALLVAAAISLAVGPALYAAAPAACRHWNVPVPGRGDLPYRDGLAYWLTPWKGQEDSAARFARQALRQVPANATIIADSTSQPPLAWTQRVEGLGKAVLVLSMRTANPQIVPVGTKNVYVVSDLPGYCPDWVLKDASVRKDRPGDVLFGVHWKAHKP